MEKTMKTFNVYIESEATLWTDVARDAITSSTEEKSGSISPPLKRLPKRLPQFRTAI
jgi:hypothetical protein